MTLPSLYLPHLKPGNPEGVFINVYYLLIYKTMNKQIKSALSESGIVLKYIFFKLYL